MIGGQKHEFFKSKKAEEHKKKIKAKTVRLDRRSGVVFIWVVCCGARTCRGDCCLLDIVLEGGEGKRLCGVVCTGRVVGGLWYELWCVMLCRLRKAKE